MSCIHINFVTINYVCDELSDDKLSVRRIVRATNSLRRIVRDELSGDELSVRRIVRDELSATNCPATNCPPTGIISVLVQAADVIDTVDC